ncbi:MAG: PIN domain-containing protein [Burkholderiaceae bacterium]|nr:PIN domain-containing protein [Burkholderiaceae bacterium]
MKQPDTNVLIYAVNKAARQHQVAIEWLQDAFAAAAGVGLTWTSLLGFVRISTHPHVLERPLSIEDALATVEFWLGQSGARLIGPADRHLALLRALLGDDGAGGNITTDAHLAAIAIEHGATLASFDSDFERFEGLRFERLHA